MLTWIPDVGVSAYPAVASDQLLKALEELEEDRRIAKTSPLCSLLAMRGRAAISHSHLPAGLLALMRRVVNYHSSWVGQQQVELLMHLVFRFGVKMSGCSPYWGLTPRSLWGCCVCFPVCSSGFPGFAAGRDYDPAGGAPGGG
ncbi:ABC transporter C family member 3-like [Dorcoceras hygrometricum]|uniref:ABC transporter C family member 3-like n=1 Tax=Dorcoceras hygrometricum TaxID=472368 RepID=A0A2Z7AUJ0_9LAMI|nr:ABC transporter C family member 3-like [Dorcoceras hygrometricum]